jgi:PAS domain S-box-containing protein
MEMRMSKSKHRKTGEQDKRLTIGYLTSHLYEHLGQWFGVADAAQKHDVNLITFPGWSPHYPEGFQAQASILYELASAENVDGLISWASSIGNYMSIEELQAFHDRYRPLPVVTVGRTLKGFPSLLMDSYSGMRDEIAHLIEVHGYRRLAFIRGPETHFYAQERYRAYLETLRAHGISFDPKLVTPPSVWGRDTGVEGAKLLLDERKLRLQDDIEAIVSVSDDTLLGALEVLQARGIHVPRDVAIAGFDDRIEGRTATPPLTSVASPFYEVGYQAVETLLTLMAGEQVPEEATVSSKLVVRQSCGCESLAVLQAAADLPLAVDLVETSRKELGVILSKKRKEIVAGVTRAVQDYGGSLDSELAGQLLDGFVTELGGESHDAFLATLNEVLRQVATVGGIAAGSQIAAMQSAVSALRRSMLPYLDGEAFLKAEDLWQQARVMIGEMAQRVQVHEQLLVGQQTDILQGIGRELITTFDVAELADILAKRLPDLGIYSCFLSLYEGSQRYEYPQPAPEWSRLVMGYAAAEGTSTDGGTESIANAVSRFELPPDGQRFRSRQLVPQGILPQGRLYNIIVRALYFRENQLGFALFETGRRQAEIYETLRSEISSALYGALLVQQTRDYAVRVQTAAEVSQAASSILDPDELIRQVVELAQERFDLYYAGLFLVDQTGEWAVLHAGTGKAGQRMLKREHKLEIGGDSMIGWCIANKQARIALDVGEDAVRFENPYLPETRSELALPLVSRGDAIGALTIQSTEEAAFSEEDVAVLQTMADQLANAIANARLFEALAREQYLTNALMDNIPDHIYFKDTESRFIRMTRSLAGWFGLGDPGQVVGKTDFDFFTEDHARPAYDDEQRIIETGEPILGVEERETWPDRPDTWVLTSKLPLRDEAGNIVGTFGISRDITRLKLAELALERRALQLQTAAEVSHAASSILDPDDMIRQVVNLVRERFDLYYAGLFLVDQADEWAVLRAGTGEAGRQMLARGHRLEIGGGSMIGWCIANKQARIALDVGEEAVRFENPFLPETRSELALPLVSRGEAIGALTIQSTEEAAFSDEDVAVLQTMADQLANAIANVRLFEQTQIRAEEMTVLNDLSQALAAHLSVQAVLDEVYRGASRLLGATNFYIALYDPRKHEITFPLDTTQEELDVVSVMSADQGLTGYVIRNRTSLLIEENLPERMAELGIETVGKPSMSWLGAPMIAGDEVLGMLGVQDFTTPRAYDEHSQELLVALANQTATSLVNARLFEQTQAALSEVEAMQRRYLERAWSDYAQARAVSGYEQSEVGVESLDETLPEVQQAMRERRTIILGGADDTSVLVVPVVLRGQPLGALGFKLQGGARKWSVDDVVLVEGIGEQFALAAENIRLLDETQRRAARERLTRDITDKMRRAASIEDIVQTAVDELFGALRTSRAFVRLGVDSSEQGDGKDE